MSVHPCSSILLYRTTPTIVNAVTMPLRYQYNAGCPSVVVKDHKYYLYYIGGPFSVREENSISGIGLAVSSSLDYETCTWTKLDNNDSSSSGSNSNAEHVVTVNDAATDTA
jgi:hypothetical protein